MAYKMYIDDVLCPVTPSKIQMKIKNQNKTMTLIDMGEVNFLRNAGLTEISFDLLLPNVQYPFAIYKSGFVGASYFLNKFEQLKVGKKPFQFKVTRTLPGEKGRMLFNTDMTVSLEDYTITEDVKQGFDITVSIKLKQYRTHEVKKIKVKTDSKTNSKVTGKATVEQKRDSSKKTQTSTKTSTQTYTVVKGDCLWNIAKKYYGDGSKWTVIYNANKSKLKSANLIYPGQVLTIPKL